MFRRFASLPASPWKFGNTKPLFPQKPIQLAVAQTALPLLREGFTYAFHTVMEALAAHDLSTLQQCLEPRLYQHVATQLSLLKSDGYSIHLQEPIETPTLEICNFCTVTGVHIDRAQNLPKNRYLSVVSLSQIREMLKNPTVRNTLKSMGLPALQEDLPENADEAFVYYHTDAPANMILAYDAVFRLKTPLRLLHKETELPGTHVEEVHTLRFESCGMKLGTQADMLKLQPLDVMKTLQEAGLDIFRNDWIVVDIDYSLEGNPHAVAVLEQ